MSNIEALQAKLPDEACGALITSDVSRRYFCGFKSSAGVILVTKEQSYLIIDSRYFDKAKQRVTDCRVILLEDMRTQLSELLLKHDIRRLMLESDYMTLSEFAAYKEQLHFVELDATSWLSDFIWGMRIIKTAEEVKLIVKAQRIAEKAFERLVDNIHRDMTEKQVAALLNYYMMDLGADDLSFETIAASGVNSASPHAVPTDKKAPGRRLPYAGFRRGRGQLPQRYDPHPRRRDNISGAGEALQRGLLREPRRNQGGKARNQRQGR